MDIFGKQTDSMLNSAAKARKLRLITTGVLILLVLAVVSLYTFLSMRSAESPEPEPVVKQVQDSSVELISTNGIVMLRKPGWTEWKPVTAGARLMEGDSIQTDATGSASIRYPDGATLSFQENTLFTVQDVSDGKNAISALPVQAAQEITMPKAVAKQSEGAAKPGEGAVKQSEGAAKPGEGVAKQSESTERKEPAKNIFETTLPTIVLERIIPFGRSLEIVGQVEPGTKLVVNGETVDVTGNGSFKHFTNPFPTSAGRIRLVLKATNLAGGSRILSTSYDFNPHGGE